MSLTTVYSIDKLLAGFNVQPKFDFQRKRDNILFKKIITCGPSIYLMDHTEITVSNFMVRSTGLKWMNPLSFPVVIDILHYK